MIFGEDIKSDLELSNAQNCSKRARQYFLSL